MGRDVHPPSDLLVQVRNDTNGARRALGRCLTVGRGLEPDCEKYAPSGLRRLGRLN